MKNTIVTIFLLMIYLPLQAQDITNKLGGNTAAVKYDVTDSGNNVLFRVQGDGNVGIGTGTPDEKLHVVGNIKIVDGTQGINKKLLSNASGQAAWS
ncbi:MAG: hypothetical protein MUP82_01790, partial [Candidatus Marinimicrobia bacterium]|nr:hypothetical protein [Candidatus Neomarinimicrobiota bacterium]